MQKQKPTGSVQKTGADLGGVNEFDLHSSTAEDMVAYRILKNVVSLRIAYILAFLPFFLKHKNILTFDHKQAFYSILGRFR